VALTFQQGDKHEAFLKVGRGTNCVAKEGSWPPNPCLRFINEADGRLVVRDGDGNVVQDAHKIIYPGSNGDAWWDTEQLLKQVKSAIGIFETAHPNCTSLFIFDQSSAHGSLPPDALKAFEMNKSDDGKQ
jgi:hypothetical protein